MNCSCSKLLAQAIAVDGHAVCALDVDGSAQCWTCYGDQTRPLFALIMELRAAGFGPRLRAGQFLSSLGLSRAKEHGLRSEQSHLFLAPQSDGRIRVSGSIRTAPVEFGPVRATFDGDLRRGIYALAELPID